MESSLDIELIKKVNTLFKQKKKPLKIIRIITSFKATTSTSKEIRFQCDSNYSSMSSCKGAILYDRIGRSCRIEYLHHKGCKRKTTMDKDLPYLLKVIEEVLKQHECRKQENHQKMKQSAYGTDKEFRAKLLARDKNL